MAVYGLSPPRLPEPPEEIDKRYMLDLVRAVQIFISQSNEKDNFNHQQAINWFMN